MKNLLFTLICFLTYFLGNSQVIYQHNFGTSTISGNPYTVSPTSINANLSSSSWSTSNSGGFVDYGGSTGRALSVSLSSTGTITYTLTFNVSPNYTVDISSFSFWRRRSNTGPTGWSMTINSISVGSGTMSGTGGSSVGPITVSSPVQNLSTTINVIITITGGSSGGTFRLDDFTLNGVVNSPLPSNSDCSTVTSLSLPTTEGSTTTTGTQTTCGRGNDFPVNSFGSSLYGGGEDAVWSITVPSGGGNYQFDLGGTGTYKILSLHSSCTPSNGNVLNWNTTSSSTSTSFTQNLSAGTYYLWTDTWPNPTCGEYSITVTKLAPPPSPPSNDDPSGAILLTVNEPLGYVTYSNVSSTSTTTESSPSCASYTGGDVWFKVVVPNNITVLDFDTQTGDITDGGMSIYRGTIGSLTQIECDDDDGLDGLMPWIYREDFTPGETIYIRFWEYGGGTAGTFKILVSTPQALPVELTQFEAVGYPRWNVVKWTTASEHNSSFFSLQSSYDGEVWREIAIKDAAGNSTEEIKYSWIDYNQKELTYYRLVQVDFDGMYDIYGPISVMKSSSSKEIVKYVNLMGQEVNPLTTIGLVIEVYSDGSTRKVIR